MFGWRKKNTGGRTLDVPTPMPGQVVGLEQVPDEAFSSKAMGEGFAVHPVKGEARAPFSGRIAHVMAKSKHAVVLENDDGIQLLIHVGVGTVSLKGEGFTAHVEAGQKVKKGQLLLEFDIPRIEQAGYPVITSIIVPGGQETIKEIETLKEQEAILRIHY